MTSRKDTLLHTPTTGDSHETWEKRYPRGGGTKTSHTESRRGDSDGQVILGDDHGTELTHIDLFSGIGGFSLAAGWAGFRTIAFCDNDPFCQEVLKARFGAVADSKGSGLEGAISTGRTRTGGCPPEHNDGPLLIPDIFAFDGTRFRGATLLTGGFPCQPFSHSGKRRGKDDSRAIWPQMLRVIHEARPAWVIGENVSGLISMELDSVLADLEMEGYATRTFHIGAVGVNAPHRRMRVWIVAHDDSAGQPHRAGEYRGSSTSCGTGERCDGIPSSIQAGWDIPWIEVATRFCRVDDGLPPWIHSRRVQRLKALGNAIVPAVAFQIIKAIADIERGMK